MRLHYDSSHGDAVSNMFLQINTITYILYFQEDTCKGKTKYLAKAEAKPDENHIDLQVLVRKG